MLVEFEDLANFESANRKAQALREIKNDMVGSEEIKIAYFEKGLVDQLITLLQASDKELFPAQSEAAQILNCILLSSKLSLDNKLVQALKSSKLCESLLSLLEEVRKQEEAVSQVV